MRRERSTSDAVKYAATPLPFRTFVWNLRIPIANIKSCLLWVVSLRLQGRKHSFYAGSLRYDLPFLQKQPFSRHIVFPAPAYLGNRLPWNSLILHHNLQEQYRDTQGKAPSLHVGQGYFISLHTSPHSERKPVYIGTALWANLLPMDFVFVDHVNKEKILRSVFQNTHGAQCNNIIYLLNQHTNN